MHGCTNAVSAGMRRNGLLTPLTYIRVGEGAKLAKRNLCGLGVLARENDFFMPREHYFQI